MNDFILCVEVWSEPLKKWLDVYTVHSTEIPRHLDKLDGALSWVTEGKVQITLKPVL